MGFRVLVGDPISEGPRLGPDNSSHGERDVRGTRSRMIHQSFLWHRRNLDRLQRKFDASLTQGVDRGNKSFIIKGRGSSGVEQPIRKLQQRRLNKRLS